MPFIVHAYNLYFIPSYQQLFFKRWKRNCALQMLKNTDGTCLLFRMSDWVYIYQNLKLPMKKYLIIPLLACCTTAIAQQKLISNAVISTTTNVEAPEEDELQNVQNQSAGGGRGNIFRNFGDGETKSTTYLKDNMVKTVLKTDVMRSIIIRNNTEKMTTTLIEAMGTKTGFYMTDADTEKQRLRMDSMMQARRDSSKPKTTTAAKVYEIGYGTETKKIAGYNCKKAYIISTNILGLKDSAAVWYTPDIKMQNLSSTGGTMGFGGNQGFNLIDGFVMAYSSNMPRNRKMSVEVTKIDLSKNVEDKEFLIPKDFEVKPMSEMRNVFGGAGGGRITVERQ